MDQHFCPSCEAILEDQFGFDPAVCTWTCTECGQVLIGEDEYDGDLYPDVVWRCDSCGSFLNRQSGFSDVFSTWMCTECFHMNSISLHDIFDSEDDLTPGNYCTLCGSDLDIQPGFEDSDGVWTCSICGQTLYGDEVYEGDVYPGVIWYCDQCESVLNQQPGFSDTFSVWNCAACGYANSISDYEIFSSREEYEDQWQQQRVNESLREEAQRQEEIREGILLEKTLRKKRFRARLFNRKKIPAGVDSEILVGKKLHQVVSALHAEGFTNIKPIPIKDLYVGSDKSIFEVEQVVLDKTSYFESTDKFAYDAAIIITYHQRVEIVVPFSHKYISNLSHREAVDRFHALGFTEVYVRPIPDLILGWFKKDGSIEQVSIDGNTSFRKNAIYPYDCKILIVYHTFKNR